MKDQSGSALPFNIYLDPQEARWLDSLEGVPDVGQWQAPPSEQFLHTDWQKKLHRGLDWAGAIAPGIALAAVLGWISYYAAAWIGKSLLGFEKSPLSPILVTVLLGLLVRNVAGLPTVYEKGLRLCLKRLLRVGIALLGLRLSLAAVGQIGLSALPVVIGCIATAILVASWLSRAIGMPSRLGTLIAVGTSICGVSAVVATGPAIDAEEEEVSYAVAVITCFGMIALFGYPYLAHFLLGDNLTEVGLFLGTAIHDTAQVAGAGMIYADFYDAEETLDIAATTKLVRNVFMGVVIPMMAIMYRRQADAEAGKSSAQLKWSQYIPMFVVGFLVLAAFRTTIDFWPNTLSFLGEDFWKHFLTSAKLISVGCLTVAMASVGLGTSFAQLRRLGWKPMIVGLTTAVLVGVVSIMLIKLVGYVL